MNYSPFQRRVAFEEIVPAGSLYHTTSIPDTFQANTWNDLIDPQLESSPPPALNNSSQWDAMHRYLLGSHQTNFQLPPGHDQRQVTSHGEYTFQLPSTNDRHASPFSHLQSSTCSSVQSPPAGSDSCMDGMHGPSTPPDITIASPFPATALYDSSDDHASQHSMGSKTGFQPGGCVNPLVFGSGYQDLTSASNFEPAFDLNQRHSTQGYDSPLSFDHDSVSFEETQRPRAILGERRLEPKEEIHVNLATSGQKSGVAVTSGSVQLSGMPTLKSQSSVRTNPVGRSNKSRKASFKKESGCGVQKRRSANKQTGNSRRVTGTSAENQPRQLSPTSIGLKHCDQCNLSFKEESQLKKHRKMEHTRPFTCVFAYAGCTSTFATKNEWKRHVTSQHLSLTYWLCVHGNCGHSKGPATQHRSTTLPSYGVIFNRKDLFTQHIRRMHLPDGKETKGRKGSSPAIDERLKQMQDEALRQRCKLPTFMQCPAQHCDVEFRGQSAWDERMEHVARHLDAASVGKEPPVYFGGHHDQTLTNWAEQEGVEVVKRTVDGWEICNPLKGDTNLSRTNFSISYEGEEEDAEGELC